MKCLQGLLYTFYDLEFVEGELCDDLLDAEVDVLREFTATEFHGSVGHSDQIGLGTVSEKRNVLLLLAPKHCLNTLRTCVVG